MFEDIEKKSNDLIEKLRKLELDGRETEYKSVLNELLDIQETLDALASRIHDATAGFEGKLTEHVSKKKQFLESLLSSPTNATSPEVAVAPPAKTPVLASSAKSEGSWATVAGKGAKVAPKHRVLVDVSAVQPIVGLGIKQVRVPWARPNEAFEIAPGIMEHAHVVSNPSECHLYKGALCYDKATGIFWFSLNGVCLPLDILHHTQPGARPLKTIEYNPKYSKGRDTAENFYRPPELYGGNDKRNLPAEITFCPFEVDVYARGAVRASSRERLASDLKRIDDSDKRYIAALSGHWIGVALSLHQ